MCRETSINVRCGMKRPKVCREAAKIGVCSRKAINLLVELELGFLVEGSAQAVVMQFWLV